MDGDAGIWPKARSPSPCHSRPRVDISYRCRGDVGRTQVNSLSARTRLAAHRCSIPVRPRCIGIISGLSLDFCNALYYTPTWTVFNQAICLVD